MIGEGKLEEMNFGMWPRLGIISENRWLTIFHIIHIGI